jgi:aminoglycoside phosphotransferase family enzyme/adenylate kinase family enzyme
MTDRTALPDLARAMLRPDFYPHGPATVELVQTHISYVFLAGDEVYKVKKPVRFAFLDFSSLERRRHFCHEEVRLNRRLAGDTYRNVVAIRPSDDGFALGPEEADDAVDYAVHMRRLPAERMLVKLLERNAVGTDLMDTIAARLVAFHVAADAGPEVARGGDPRVIAKLLDDDFREVDAFHGDTIPAADDDAIRRFCRDYLRGHDGLLRRRQAEGRIRDGHGDLHAEHVCCTDPLVIFDCIEFNPSFRHRDVAAEIAFLAMDLVFHHRPDLADRLVARYSELARDPDLPLLVPFYACQRAYIRGKVESLKSIEIEVDAPARAAARLSAAAHFALAYRYTWSYTPRLVVVTGLSGTGKSTVATALHARTGFVHINSDATRKRLFGVAPTARPGAALYTAERSAATYEAMYAAAGAELAGGRGAILDATFQRRAHRDAARNVARQRGVPVLFIECVAPEEEVRRRLAERARADTDVSDADWAVYQQQRGTYEPFAADELAEHAVVDSSPIDAQLTGIEAKLRAM